MTDRQRFSDAALIREIYPVTKAKDYGSGCYEFIRVAKHKSRAIRPERGKIMSLTKKSLLRLMFVMQCTHVELSSMLTLTYPCHYPKDGQIVKKDLNVILQKIRRLGWSYVWFLEFQDRDAPHIHVLLSSSAITPYTRANFGLFWTERIASSEWFREACPPDEYLREVLKMAKFNCNQKTMELLRKSDGAKRYATRYAAKERQKKVPKNYKNVGRFWGASADVRPEGLAFDVSEDDVEQWLLDNDHPAGAYELVPRYIWGLGTIMKNKNGEKPGQAKEKSEV